jgi:hypothetical protein
LRNNGGTTLIGSSILNNNFDAKVFLQLLAHIIKTTGGNIAFLGE